MHVEGESENTSLALTPTWSVATVLTVLVLVSLLVERSIHWLSHWLKKTNRSPIFDALEKIKEELMLLGFLSLLLSTTSRNISKICIKSTYYSSTFSPCILSNSEKGKVPHRDGRLLMGSFLYPSRRSLSNFNDSSCEKGYVPFVSHEGLEQLHRFIFLMGITHVLYSCLTMLLAIVKVYTWGRWEGHARMKRHDSLSEVTREKTMKRQSTFVKYHTSGPWSRNRLMVWMKCFFRQFGHSVVRADYLTLRKGFIMNHNLPENYDFHSYMIRSMEEEFKMIVGVSAPLWGFVIAFMLFNVHGSNLYFWIAFFPIFLILLMGTELQHIIATLALEFAGVTEFSSSGRLHPRDELFWFKKPELLLYLIHFVLFQNAFELASFFWFWWQFSYDSCFIRNHTLVYIRLFLGFSGQFLCSYSTLPLYALVTQMGTNYKAVLIPRRIRESIRGWGKTARRRRKKKERYGSSVDDPTIHTDTSAILSLEDERETSEDLDNSLFIQIELQRNGSPRFDPSPISTENSSISQTNPLLQNSLSFPAQSHDNPQENKFPRSFSMPVKR